MHQSSSGHAGYRIKKINSNLIAEGSLKQQDDFFKISIHSSSHKSPSKNNTRNLSLANKHNNDKYSQRSRKKNDSRTNLSSSSLSGGSRRIQKSTKIRQFANVKQLLMIKAYDKKLLKNVTGSSNANKNFLKLGEIKNDPFRKQTFKVMIQNFKQITIRIRGGYQKVLNKILFSNTSPISTLAGVRPILQKVKQQADDMHSKVKQCQQTLDARQFRQLIQGFLTFLNAAQDIEQIIFIVNKSKQRIDDLFKNLQKDSHLDQKLNIQRKKGIKKVRNAVKQYGNDGIQAQILNKVEAAINQMADKNLEAYNKINGAKFLMTRIRECLKQNKQTYELQDIVKINHIFKQVLEQANAYQRFAQKFLQQTDIVNDDLRACIHKYRQQVQMKRSSVQIMEIKFITNILQISFQNFQSNYSVCNAIDSNLIQDYIKINKLLEQICELISNKNAIGVIKALFRDINAPIKTIEKQIKKIKATPKKIIIDTQQGLQTLIQFSQLVNEYKHNIKEIIYRKQRAYKEITKKRFRKQQIGQEDLEQASIHRIIQISKKLNSGARKQAIQNSTAFRPIGKNPQIQQLAAELGSISFYKQFKALYEEVQKIQQSNQINSIISQLQIQQKLYHLSGFFCEVYELASSVTQATLLKGIQTISERLKKSINYCPNIKMQQCFIERLFAYLIQKGLDKRTIKMIINKSLVKFPETQHDVESIKRDIKYLKTVSNILPDVIVKKQICDTFSLMQQLFQGLKISQDLIWNKDKLYYLQGETIFNFATQCFSKCFMAKQKIHLDKIIKQLKSIAFNLEKLKQNEINSKHTQTRIQKVLQVIGKFQKINKKLEESIKKLRDKENLQIYSNLVFCFGQYLKSTTQSFYCALNKSNNIVWISDAPTQSLKFNKFGQFIGFSQLKAGQISKKYNQKPIVVRKQKPKPKQKQKAALKNNKPNKKKNSEQQIEDQDIVDEEQIQNMDENIEQVNDDVDQEVEQQMEQQMGEQMEQQMQQQMGEQFAQQPDQQIASENIENDSKIEFQFEQEEGSRKNQKKQGPKSKQKQQQNNNTKVQSPKKQQTKKQAQVVIKEKKSKQVFEVFKYIETLEDLQIFIVKFVNIRSNFWKSANLKLIQSYFNYQRKQEIQKQMLQQLDKFCKSQYIADFVPSIKKSQNYKSIIKQIDNLNCLKFDVFRQVLNLIKKQFGSFFGLNKQLLRVSVKNNDSWQNDKVVKEFVKKNLVIAGVKQQDFEMQSYIGKLTKNQKQLETKFKLCDKIHEIKGQDLKQQLKEFDRIVTNYKDFKKFSESVNLYQVILRMWYNCIHQNQTSKIEIGQKLNDEIGKIQRFNKTQNAFHYIKDLNSTAKKTLELLKNHQKDLSSIFENLDRDNLFKSIHRLLTLYEYEQSNMILYEDHPVMIRQTNKNEQVSSELKTIRQFFLLFSKTQSKLTPSEIKQSLTKNPSIYLENQQPKAILSILQIQSHIFCTQKSLNIYDSRTQLLNGIIRVVSDGIIKDPTKQLCNIEQINSSVSMKSTQPLIFQYQIKQNPKMVLQNNRKYHKQYLKVIQTYEKHKKGEHDVGDTVFESLFEFDDQDSSVTTDIFDYTQSLSLVLKEPIFQNSHSIFIYHNQIQGKLEQIKKQIDSEVRLLLAVVQQPINVNTNKLDECLVVADQKNKAVQKWFLQFNNKKIQQLSQVYVCPCLNSQCAQTYRLYVGLKSNHLQDYFKRVEPKNDIYKKFIKNFMIENENKKVKESMTIHVGKIVKQLAENLKKINGQLYRQFINYYNIVHFISSGKKDNKLQEYYNNLLNYIENKQQIVKFLALVPQKLKKSPLSKSLVTAIQKQIGYSLNQLQTNLVDEKQKLSKINLQRTDYRVFGNWAINIAGKMHKIPCYILLDCISKQELVCIIASKDTNQLRSNLKSIGLQSDFTLIQQKNAYKKIYLNKQTFHFKLDQKIISKQNLQEYDRKTEGLQNYQEKTESWVIGVYKKVNQQGQKDYQLLGIYPISQKSTQINQHEVQLCINQVSIRTDIQFKILEVKYENGQQVSQNHIVRQLKSENVKNVELNSVKVLDALSKWLVSQLPVYRLKRQQQKQRLLKYRQKDDQELNKAVEIMIDQGENGQQIKSQKHNTSTDKQKKAIKQETKQYLNLLYRKLQQKQVYSISGEQLQESIGKVKQKEDNSKLRSFKNIQIIEQTQQALKQLESDLNQQVIKQFSKLSQDYLCCLSNMASQRQQIMQQIISNAQKIEENLTNNVQPSQVPHSKNILLELTKFPGYNPALNPKIMGVYSNLSQYKKDKLKSIYQKKETKAEGKNKAQN